MLLIKLFIAFIQVGLFSVGGGYAAIPLIQEQIVDIYHLMTLSEFSDLITVAEMTPADFNQLCNLCGHAHCGDSRRSAVHHRLHHSFVLYLPDLSPFLLQIPQRKRRAGCIGSHASRSGCLNRLRRCFDSDAGIIPSRIAQHRAQQSSPCRTGHLCSRPVHFTKI